MKNDTKTKEPKNNAKNSRLKHFCNEDIQTVQMEEKMLKIGKIKQTNDYYDELDY